MQGSSRDQPSRKPAHGRENERDLEELILAIGTYIDRHNKSPKPFIWTARAGDILEKVKRARRTLNKRRSV
jgi:hypothetical protein